MSAPASITFRAVMVALLCVVAICTVGCFSSFLRYDLIGTGHLPRCAVCLVLAIMVLNPVLKRFGAAWQWSRAEILFVYCTVLVMTGIPGQQFANYLYTGVTSPFYYSTEQNGFKALFHDHIPAWAVPSKDPESPAVKWMFEGMPDGKGFFDIPWALWVRPLLFWTPFFVLVFWISLGMCALLRKQWVEHERLRFPLARVMLDTTAHLDDLAQPSLFQNRYFWYAFALPVAVFLLNGIHAYSPTFFMINLRPNIGGLFFDRPWNRINYKELNVFFDMIGIAYLLASEIGFSLWFFFWFRCLQEMAGDVIGVPLEGGFFAFENYGALLPLVAVYLYMGRHHFLRMIKVALGLAPPSPPGEEVLSEKSLVWGLVGCLLALEAWCMTLGLSWWVAPVLFGTYYMTLLVMTRLVSEAGVWVWWSPLNCSDFYNNFIGLGGGPVNATLTNLVAYNINDTASSPVPQALQSLKIAGETNLNKRHVFIMMMVAVVVAVLACHIPMLYVMYTNGIPSGGWWFRNTARNACDGIANTFIDPKEMTMENWRGLCCGAGLSALLLYLRQCFVWWPFHPLGFIAMNSLGRHWFSIFFGWLIKVTVLKLGGVQLWRRFLPAALGLVIGNAVILFLWGLIHNFFPITEALVME